ncbi:hypothetical protein [Paraglaciecola aestuariivivens]
MAKPLLKVSLFTLFIIACLAILVNFQRVTMDHNNEQNIQTIKPSQNSIDWKTTLEQHPQFKSTTKVKQATVVEDKQQSILDAQLVGIVADEPSSVLLAIPSTTNNELTQLSLGDGWLENWTIETILPDAVIWINNKTKQTLTQSLFDASTHKNVESKTKKSGKK